MPKGNLGLSGSKLEKKTPPPAKGNNILDAQRGADYASKMLLKEYIAALWVYWWALMSCAAFTILAFAAEKIPRIKKLNAKLMAILAIIFLFISSYLAWKKEYEKTQPGLHVSIERLGLSPDQKYPGMTQLFAIVSISNLGPPSIADSFIFRVQTNDGMDVTESPYMFDPDSPLTVVITEGESLKYSSSDALYLKTGGNPIPTGGKKIGILGAHLANITFKSADQSGTKITLLCEDVAGNVISSPPRIKGTGNTHELGFYPGMTPMSQK
jgi:hypothetical protein